MLPIFNNKEFQGLDYGEKRNIALNYFNKNLSDDEFQQLDNDEKEKVVSNYLKKNIGEPTRSWGDVASDTAMQLGRAGGKIVEGIGNAKEALLGNDNELTLSDLITGNNKPKPNMLQELGGNAVKFYDDRMSEGYKQRVKDYHVEDADTSRQVSGLETARHAMTEKLAPTAVGVASMIPGAQMGATVGAVGGPIGSAIGGVVGGLATGILGSTATEKAQDYLVNDLFPDVGRTLGINKSQRALDQQQHPYIDFGAGLVPQAIAFRPSLSGIPTKLGALNAGLGGGLEAGQELIQNGQIDPYKVAMATGAGALMNKPTVLGQKLMNVGENVTPNKFKSMNQMVEEFKTQNTQEPQATPQEVSKAFDVFKNPNENLINEQPKDNAPTSPIIETPKDVPTIEKPSETTVKQPNTDTVETSTKEVAPKSNNGEATINENFTTPEQAKLEEQLSKAETMEKEAMKNGDLDTAKKISEAKKEIEDKLLFSKADEKDLIVQHNLSEDNLHYALKNGGLAVPSLAITKKGTPLTGFGEISLLGDKNLADPKGTAGTRVFGADIYSPRHPREEREYKSADIRKMDKELSPYSTKLRDGSINESRDVKDLYDNKAMQMKFLEEEKGMKLEVPTKKNPNEEEIARLYPSEYKKSLENKGLDWQTLYKDENFRQKVINDLSEKLKARGKDTDPIKVYGEDGINNIARDRASEISSIGRNQGQPDYYAMRDLLRQEIEKHSQEYRDYVDKFTEPYDYKSYFYDGNKRKQYNQDTVLSYLIKNLRGGENYNYGSGNVRAMVTPEFKSIKEIKSAKDRLITAKEFEGIKDSLNNELLDIAHEISSKGVGNRFTATDIATEFIQDYAKRGKRAINDYAVDVTPESLKRIDEFLSKLKEAPTEYFEAKIARMAQPSEFHTAVVPDNVSSKTLEALEKQGLNIEKYKSGDEADRARAIKEASEKNDLAFSKGKGDSTTAEKATKIVDDLLGKSKVRNDVKVVQTFEDLPTGLKDLIRSSDGTTRGVFDPETGKAYLVADTMGEHEVKGILLHELMHRAVNNIVAEKGGTRLEAIMGSNLKPIVERLNELKRQGDKDVIEAMKRVLDAGTSPQHKVEETLAYLLQGNINKYSTPLQEFLHKVATAIKDFVKRMAIKMGVEPQWLASRMTVDDIANVLKSYALDKQSATTNDSPLMSKSFKEYVGEGKKTAEELRGSLKDYLHDQFNKTALERSVKLLNNPKDEEWNSFKELYKNTLPQAYMDDLDAMVKSKNTIERKVGIIKGALSTLTPEQRTEIHKYIVDDSKTISPELKKIVDKSQEVIKNLSDDLVYHGVLDKRIVEAWEGKYLRQQYTNEDEAIQGIKTFKDYFFGEKKTIAQQYEKGLSVVAKRDSDAMDVINGYMRAHGHDELVGMGTKEAIEYLKKNGMMADSKQWKSEGKIKITELKNGNYEIKRGYTEAERERMGEVTDSAITIPDTILRLSTMLEHAKMLQRTMVNNRDYITDVREVADNLGWKQIEDKPQYGVLAGKYARPDIARDIMSNQRELYEKGGLVDKWLKGLSLWKKSKTVWNPTGHVNNFTSNIFIKYGLGIDPFKGTLDAGKQLSQIKEFEALEVKDAMGNMTKAEETRFNELRESLQDALELRDNGKLGHTQLLDINRGFEKDGVTPETTNVFMKSLHKADDAVSRLYGAGDTIHRLSAYTAIKKAGYDSETAMMVVDKLFPDYSKPMPLAFKIARDTGISPFISWTYYTLPAIARITKANPMRALGAYSALGAVGFLGMLWSQDGDLSKAMDAFLNLPEDAIGRRMPIWKNDKGEVSTWKVDRLIPGMDLASPLLGAISGGVKGAKEKGDWSHIALKAIDGSIMGLGNTVRSYIGGPTVNALFFNTAGKDSFTNNDIVKKDATDKQRVYQTAKYLVEQYAPLPTPLIKIYDMIEGQVKGDEERKRNAITVPRNALENAIGLAGMNVLRYDQRALEKQIKDFSPEAQDFTETKQKLSKLDGMLKEAKQRNDFETYKEITTKHKDELPKLSDFKKTEAQLNHLKQMRDRAMAQNDDKAVLMINEQITKTMKAFNERNKK